MSVWERELTFVQDFFAHLSQGTPYRSATHLKCAARHEVQLLTVRLPPVRFLFLRNGELDGGVLGCCIEGCLRGVLPFLSLIFALSFLMVPWSLGSIIEVN